VIYPGPPDEVIALAFQNHAARGKFNFEAATDEDDQCGPLVAGSPFGAFVASRVDSPLDFDILA
jgi:hypothetical protein